jgi:hypothetical protein
MAPVSGGELDTGAWDISVVSGQRRERPLHTEAASRRTIRRLSSAHFEISEPGGQLTQIATASEALCATSAKSNLRGDPREYAVRPYLESTYERKIGICGPRPFNPY